MSVKVHYFASLRERVGCAEESLDLQPGATVRDAWDRGCAGFPIPQNTLCALNEEYTSLDANLSDGDRVAFFPPVTGG
ncbi:MAG TPA: molybdopterin synthase sulfur carrier subunit [Gammaproteobacteria bacterium]|nr:molybdopterin synthase sulfur carrier subunit [Gammaproteobacteria bacterium]